MSNLYTEQDIEYRNMVSQRLTQQSEGRRIIIPYPLLPLKYSKHQREGWTTSSKMTIDTANISGAKLAEIGRAVLGMTNPQEIKEKKLEGALIDSAWLDQRVEEICKRGRL